MEYVLSVAKVFYFGFFFFFSPGTRVSKHHKQSSRVMWQSHRAAFLSTLLAFFNLIYNSIYAYLLYNTAHNLLGVSSRCQYPNCRRKTDLIMWTQVLQDPVQSLFVGGLGLDCFIYTLVKAPATMIGRVLTIVDCCQVC